MDPTGFTVVVRTPNQKFQDVNIQLNPDSTIKELKVKIECDHPGSPKANSLKLIYNGRMLIDHHRVDAEIKESNSVVHLVYVCDDPTPSKKETPTAATSNAPKPELRQRFTPQAPTIAPTPQPHGPHDYGTYSQAYAGWLQQYQQQYSNYMQYYAAQNPYMPMAQAAVQPVVAENGQNAANQAAAGAQEPDPQNADAGLVVAEENPQDWLDVLFALTRFMLMLSIIYFYSTTYRFVIAVSVLLAIYLYQAGYFQINRRPAVPAPEANQDPQQQPERDNNNNNDSGDDEAAEADSEQPPPPPPSILATAVCFVRTFFSSLVPAGPPGVVN